MDKGAQPSDRVMRFLDAAGIMKRPKRNNPEKAVPRKERKAKDEEAAKAAGGAAVAEGGKPAAKAAENPAKAASRPRPRRLRRRAKARPLTPWPNEFASPASAPRTACAAR